MGGLSGCRVRAGHASSTKISVSLLSGWGDRAPSFVIKVKSRNFTADNLNYTNQSMQRDKLDFGNMAIGPLFRAMFFSYTYWHAFHCPSQASRRIDDKGIVKVILMK